MYFMQIYYKKGYLVVDTQCTAHNVYKQCVEISSKVKLSDNPYDRGEACCVLKMCIE